MNKIVGGAAKWGRRLGVNTDLPVFINGLPVPRTEVGLSCISWGALLILPIGLDAANEWQIIGRRYNGTTRSI